MKTSTINFTKPYQFRYSYPASSASKLDAIIARTQANEKKMIGQELHDNVNQILSTVKLFITMLNPVDARDKEIQERTKDYVMLAIEEIRRISGELVKPRVNKGLKESITTIINDILFSTSIKAEFNCSGDIECLPADKQTALLRIVQEQLKNVIKYSKADHVLVDLRVRNEAALLVIKDNGVGFDPAERKEGIGLSNITERTQFHNGTVQLQTAKGKGCCLHISLPAA